MRTVAPETTPFPRYDPAARYDVETYDVEYRRDAETVWLARIYQPQGPGPFPALMDVHGGAWTTSDRTSNAPMANALAASGLVVVALDFRLAPDHPYPASVQDTNYGTRWFKAHAHEYNADPRHLGGLGGSSGGHVLMLSAMRPRDPRYAEFGEVTARHGGDPRYGDEPRYDSNCELLRQGRACPMGLSHNAAGPIISSWRRAERSHEGSPRETSPSSCSIADVRQSLRQDNRRGKTAEGSEPSQGRVSEQSGQVSRQPGIVRG
jgi:hypothetical protein